MNVYFIKCGDLELMALKELDAEETAAALAAYIGIDAYVYYRGRTLHEFFADPVKV